MSRGPDFGTPDAWGLGGINARHGAQTAPTGVTSSNCGCHGGYADVGTPLAVRARGRPAARADWFDALRPPDRGLHVQISLEEGPEPGRSVRGDELFFRDGPALLAAAVNLKATGPDSPAVERPRQLFTGPFGQNLSGAAHHPSADGQRFLMVRVPEAPMTRTLRAVRARRHDLRRRKSAAIRHGSRKGPERDSMDERQSNPSPTG